VVKLQTLKQGAVDRADVNKADVNKADVKKADKDRADDLISSVSNTETIQQQQ
jgi:hypothetical protein